MLDHFKADKPVVLQVRAATAGLMSRLRDALGTFDKDLAKTGCAPQNAMAKAVLVATTQTLLSIQILLYPENVLHPH
eukprot:6490645-Amphidinium_carterae.2